jgi:hypothetical protein
VGQRYYCPPPRPATECTARPAHRSPSQAVWPSAPSTDPPLRGLRPEVVDLTPRTNLLCTPILVPLPRERDGAALSGRQTGRVRSTPCPGSRLSTKHTLPLLYTKSCSAIVTSIAACAAQSGVIACAASPYSRRGHSRRSFWRERYTAGSGLAGKRDPAGLCNRDAAK